LQTANPQPPTHQNDAVLKQPPPQIGLPSIRERAEQRAVNLRLREREQSKERAAQRGETERKEKERREEREDRRQNKKRKKKIDTSATINVYFYTLL
jgi:hypothetical protein